MASNRKMPMPHSELPADGGMQLDQEPREITKEGQILALHQEIDAMLLNNRRKCEEYIARLTDELKQLDPMKKTPIIEEEIRLRKKAREIENLMHRYMTCQARINLIRRRIEANKNENPETSLKLLQADRKALREFLRFKELRHIDPDIRHSIVSFYISLRRQIIKLRFRFFARIFRKKAANK